MKSVIVVGAGVAGLSASIRLANHGFRVRVLERESQIRHKVCGEFLSGECSLYLAELGVDLAALKAKNITRFQLLTGRQKISAPLPFEAKGISRQTLDRALSDRARDLGVQVEFSSRVSDIARLSNDRYTVRLKGGKSFEADAVFMANGKHDINSFNRRVGDENSSIGFKCHMRLPHDLYQTLDHTIELHLYEDGYAGLSQIEDELVNFCCIISQEKFREIKKWPALLAYQSLRDPRLQEVFARAEWQWQRPLSVAGIPYGFQFDSSQSLAENPEKSSFKSRYDGIFVLGDQAAVIPSLTGDGMGIAFLSSKLAVAALVEWGDPKIANEKYLRQLREILRSSMKLGGVLHHVFRRPRLTGWGMAALKPFPWLVNQIINKTRSEYVSQA